MAEKFTTWRDAGTGIQPFLPAVPPLETLPMLEKGLDQLKFYVFGPLLATIKIVLILALVLLTTAIWLVTDIFFFIPVLRRLLRRLTVPLCTRLILLLMGFWSISSEWATLTKGRLQTAVGNAWPRGNQIRKGDVIVCNHCSYVDIIYLFFRFTPVFTQTSSEPGKVEKLSFWEALYRCGYPPASVDDQKLVGILDLVYQTKEAWNGPIIIFPEGTTTNGRGLLSFLPVFGALMQKSSVPIHFIGFKYPFKKFSPTFSVGNKLAHFFQLCCQWYNSMEVKYLVPTENPLTSQVIFTDANEVAVESIDALVAISLAQVVKLRTTKLTKKDKLAFLDYYAAQQKRKAS